MSTRHSGYDRADGDFYSEPAWSVAALLHHVPMCGSIHDPCCGMGTVVDVVTSKGLQATGADIADRASGRFPIQDFLSDETKYTNLVFNPPYRLTLKFVHHALDLVAHGGNVAALVPLGFLASQRRHPLFSRPECALALVLSRRPSLPPGDLLKQCGESIRHSGSIDYVWVAWQRGRVASYTEIRWAAP
jgi:hypothetical protein